MLGATAVLGATLELLLFDPEFDVVSGAAVFVRLRDVGCSLGTSRSSTTSTGSGSGAGGGGGGGGASAVTTLKANPSSLSPGTITEFCVADLSRSSEVRFVFLREGVELLVKLTSWVIVLACDAPISVGSTAGKASKDAVMASVMNINLVSMSMSFLDKTLGVIGKNITIW